MGRYTSWRECLPCLHRNTEIGVPVREFDLLPREKAWSELGLPGELPDGPKVWYFGFWKRLYQICPDDGIKRRVFVMDLILPAVSEETERVRENVFLLPKV